MLGDKLLLNSKRLHTTKLGVDRIKKNLNLHFDNADDVVFWCLNKIQKRECKITRKGKNWYAEIENFIITINAYSYTIITAHKVREDA